MARTCDAGFEPLESRSLLSATATTTTSLPGDANADGRVDLTDFTVLAANFNRTTSGGISSGDFDVNGTVDLTDFTILAAHFNQSALPTAYAPPVVITQGGTYTGDWESTNPNTPAVSIRTTEPVVIVDSNVKGPGNLIQSDVDHTDVTIRNTTGIGVNPNVAGKVVGRFYDGYRIDNAVLEHNDLQGTAGIELDQFLGSTSAGDGIAVRYNTAENIDGRKSDGAGGYLTFNERTSKTDGHTEAGYDDVQFVQVSNVINNPSIDIGWNRVVNQPGLSRVEDNISVYKSSGTSTSPIRIHDNYVQGAYTVKPWQVDTSDASWTYDWSYSGGGIMLADGITGSLATSCGWVQAYNNTVVDTTNYGITTSAGHDTDIFSNRVISDGKLDDGRTIAAQNVGISIWNSYDDASSRFYNNAGHDNTVGWMQGTARNDWWTPGASSWTNNVHASGTITTATEAAELTAWQAKLRTAGATVGPS